MQSKVIFKLSEQEALVFYQFCREVGLDPKTVAKQSLFMTIKSAYLQAEELKRKAEKEQKDGSNEGNVGSDLEVEALRDSDSNIQPDSGENVADEGTK